jgi:hypothetical protein
MPFPELEKYKKQSPRLADQLSQLEVYLAEVLDRSVPHAQNLDHSAFDIVPILVAQRLGIDEGLALVLLRVCEEAGIIIHRYHVFCPITENYIDAFDSKEDLPESIQCPFEVETEHSIDEYFTELIFKFSFSFIRDHKLVVSM